MEPLLPLYERMSEVVTMADYQNNIKDNTLVKVFIKKDTPLQHPTCSKLTIYPLQRVSCQQLKVYEPRYIAYLATSGSERETTK